jgi:pimeloyl-ACP methyl ester carboxylesterase
MKANWLDKQEYPFDAHFFEVNNQKMHYIDEGQGETILFVHGTPSWSFDFRHIIKKLMPEYRCIAIDHIGFGLSDKPEKYDYTTLNHSKTLEKFILYKKLDNITLVVHDFGGPIGLNVALQYPEKFKRIVVLNTWLWSSKNEPEFIKLSKILKSPLLPFLYLYLNFSPRFILPNSMGNHKISRHIHQHYLKPFENKKQRYGALAFAKSLLNDQDWFEELWQKRNSISSIPTLFIWGKKDIAIPFRFLHKFQSEFKASESVVFENCGHFPQEEEPEKTGEAILKFVQKNNHS